MDSRIENFMEYSALPAVGGFAGNPAPAWLWSSDGSRILWTNAAGAAFFGVRDLTALGNLTALARSPARPHIARIAEAGPVDRMTIDRLRFYRGLRIMLLTCQCQRIILENGKSAALIVAPDQKPPLKKEPLLAYADLFPASKHTVYLIRPDGTSTYSHGPFDGTLNDVSVTDEARLNSGTTEASSGRHAYVIAKLGEEDRILIVANEADSSMEPPVSTILHAEVSTPEETEPQADTEANLPGPTAEAATTYPIKPGLGNAVFAPILNTALPQGSASAIDVDASASEADEVSGAIEEQAEGQAPEAVEASEDLKVGAPETILAVGSSNDPSEQEPVEETVVATPVEEAVVTASEQETIASLSETPSLPLDAETAAEGGIEEAGSQDVQEPEAFEDGYAHVAAATEPVGQDQERDSPIAQEAEETKPDDGEAGEPAFEFEPRRRPSRFAWQMDLDQRFTFLSPEFADALGPPAADIVGKTWAEVAEAYQLDANQEVARALARRDTWSGKTVYWPVTGEALRVPVDMTALPAFDRRRVFEGYRGFGVCRTGEARPDPLESGLALAAPAPEPEIEQEQDEELLEAGTIDANDEGAADTVGEQPEPELPAETARAGEATSSQADRVDEPESDLPESSDDHEAQTSDDSGASDTIVMGATVAAAGAAATIFTTGAADAAEAGTGEEITTSREDMAAEISEVSASEDFSPEADTSEPVVSDEGSVVSSSEEPVSSSFIDEETETVLREIGDSPEELEETILDDGRAPAEEVSPEESDLADTGPYNDTVEVVTAQETEETCSGDQAEDPREEFSEPGADVQEDETPQEFSISLDEPPQEEDPDAPLELKLVTESKVTGSDTVTATAFEPVELSDDPETLTILPADEQPIADLGESASAATLSLTEAASADGEAQPESESAEASEQIDETSGQQDQPEIEEHPSTTSWEEETAAREEADKEPLSVEAVEHSGTSEPSDDTAVGIAGTAPLKPKEIETAVKTLAKEYDAAIVRGPESDTGSKPERTLDLKQADTVAPADQSASAGSDLQMPSVDAADEGASPQDEVTPPAALTADDGVPGPEIIPDLEEPDEPADGVLSVTDDNQTFMQIGEGLFGGRLTETAEAPPTLELEEAETVEPAEESVGTADELASPLEQDSSPGPDVLSAATAEPAEFAETLVRPPESDGLRESGRVIDFASRSANLVPVDTSRLSKPEKEAFRKIAEALGARLEGDFDTEGHPEHAEELAKIRAADVPEAQPIDPRLLDRLPIGIAIVRDRDVLYANETLLGLLGYSDRTALVEAGGLEAIFVEDDDLPDANRIEGTVDSPLKIRTTDGGCRPVDARMHSVPWNGGLGLMISITEKPEAAPATPQEEPDALAAAEALISEMDTVLETATDGVLELSREGLVLKANKSAEALFNASREDIVGSPFTHFLAPESHRAMLDYLDGLSRNGVASILNDGREVIGRVSTGGLIPLFMTMGRIDQSGPEMKFCAVLRDITQWKTAEEELTHAKRQAEMASSQKSDFLAKISHEIRTPLNAIIGFSEVMMEERFGPIGNDRYKDYLKDIKTSGSHIMSLINDLLDLSKIEAGKLDLSFSAVSSNTILRECVAIMQPQANREHVIIRASLPDQVPDVVADPRSLRQIALNLLSNAIKFNKSGGQVIISSAIEETGEVVLRFRDTGSGMSEKELNAALEPFRQVHTARHGSGTGLGLPLTKALVEANRASFRIESTEGQGTLVEITFPSQRVMAE